jgi:hypothetical protein
VNNLLIPFALLFLLSCSSPKESGSTYPNNLKFAIHDVTEVDSSGVYDLYICNDLENRHAQVILYSGKSAIDTLEIKDAVKDILFAECVNNTFVIVGHESQGGSGTRYSNQSIFCVNRASLQLMFSGPYERRFDQFSPNNTDSTEYYDVTSSVHQLVFDPVSEYRKAAFVNIEYSKRYDGRTFNTQNKIEIDTLCLNQSLWLWETCSN